jgi:hypothetical protein
MTEAINRHEDYQFLIEEFSKEKIAQRFSLLLENSKNFIKDRKLTEFVQVNSNNLKNAVIDYFVDISRLKEFHAMEKANAIKVAAYSAYWIYKRRPLVCDSKIPKEVLSKKPFINDINEWFCSFLLISMIFDLHEPDLVNAFRTKKWSEMLNLLNSGCPPTISRAGVIPELLNYKIY